jgi:hypothetical protein
VVAKTAKYRRDRRRLTFCIDHQAGRRRVGHPRVRSDSRVLNVTCRCLEIFELSAREITRWCRPGISPADPQRGVCRGRRSLQPPNQAIQVAQGRTG